VGQECFGQDGARLHFAPLFETVAITVFQNWQFFLTIFEKVKNYGVSRLLGWSITSQELIYDVATLPLQTHPLRFEKISTQ
jgi:hypothetical protein